MTRDTESLLAVNAERELRKLLSRYGVGELDVNAVTGRNARVEITLTPIAAQILVGILAEAK